MTDPKLYRLLADKVEIGLLEGLSSGKFRGGLIWEIKGWAILSVAALGLAGILALLLALLRVPGLDGLPWSSQEFFEKGLVAHVTFAFVVWYLGVQAALSVIATAALGPVNRTGLVAGRLGLAGAGISFFLLLAPVLLNLGEASPNNYVPVLIQPIFYVGLCTLAFSLLLPLGRLFAGIITHRSVGAFSYGVAAAGLIFVIALVCAAAAWTTLPSDWPPREANEYIFWGAGHLLQFNNTALFLCALYIFTQITLGRHPVMPSVFVVALGLLVVGASVGPMFYLIYAPGDPAQSSAFTDMFWYVLPLPAGVMLLAIVWLLCRRWADISDMTPEIVGLVIVIFLFSVGGMMGFFESSVDTRTPAHYHAELIAVTLAFMILYFALFMPLIGCSDLYRKWRFAMYVLLGGGQLIHSLGLFLAGFLGAIRKVSIAEQDADSLGQTLSLMLMGIGGMIAVIGGVIFVVIVIKSFWKNEGIRPTLMSER